jgi:hypothetical protein
MRLFCPGSFPRVREKVGMGQRMYLNQKRSNPDPLHKPTMLAA